MKRYLVFAILSVLLACPAKAEEEPEAYWAIKIKSVFSKLITRDKDDRVYSGQIKSEAGLKEFEKTYGVNLGDLKTDFKKQMLIFGITDQITTRAFQFVKQEKLRTFTLDYAETGIEYQLMRADEGKKYSHIQVFILDRKDNIPHISVKNLVGNGLSKIYDG